MSEHVGNKDSTEDELCENTGQKQSYCECFDCQDHFMDLSFPFAGCRTLEEAVERAAKLFNQLDFFYENAFSLSISKDGESARIEPPLIGGCYWIKCPGCDKPFLLDIGDNPDNYICKACHDKIESKADQPKYYNDLFDYIALTFDLMRKGARSVDGELGITKEFCECHGFDFDAVKARLQATGGYDDGEVMMNSMMNIPWLEELPKLDELDFSIGVEEENL